MIQFATILMLWAVTLVHPLSLKTSANQDFRTLTGSSLDPANIVDEASRSLMERFYEIDMRTQSKIDKILSLFKKNRLDTHAFHGVDGYGYGDFGREILDRVIAELMGAESALVRLQLFSGTHAISSALFGVLRPGDTLLCVSGHPYDTLEEVIGLRDGAQTGSRVGSLKDWQIDYDEIDLVYDMHDTSSSSSSSSSGRKVHFNLTAIDEYLQLNPKTKVIHVQRSCGYQWRPSIPLHEIERLCKWIKEEKKRDDLVIFVDNCYGELVEEVEPCHMGADLVAGSLIKNLGGTIAPCGGYVAGREKYVQAANVHLSAPGVEGGATLNQYRNFFQGLFLSPVIVGESLKGAELIATVFEKHLGYACNPAAGTDRTDIIQAIELKDVSKLIKFCEIVQSKSPVGAHIKPEPGQTSGYEDEVIFADGTFIEGSTLELSADGPLREPYVAFIQGCTHWSHWALVLKTFLREVAE